MQALQKLTKTLLGARRFLRVQWSGVGMVAGSGKIGGHVVAVNKGGAYVRTKRKPTNPRSTSQVNQRNNNTGNAQAWRGLTAAQRTGWANYAAATAKKNHFGETRYSSGFQAFVQANNTLLAIGVATITAAPVPVAVTPITSLSIVADHVTAHLTLTYAPAVPAGYHYIMRATPQYSAGKTFVKQQFRQCGTLVTANASPYESSGKYTTVFPPIANVGQKVSVQLIPVVDATGQRGLPVQATVVVT